MSLVFVIYSLTKMKKVAVYNYKFASETKSLN